MFYDASLNKSSSDWAASKGPSNALLSYHCKYKKQEKMMILEHGRIFNNQEPNKVIATSYKQILKDVNSSSNKSL